MDQEIQKVLGEIRRHKKFLITAHINPEGDSLGSQLAMKELLSAMGKEALIYDHDKVPEHYRFLPGASEIQNAPEPGIDHDAVIVLDCPNLKRIGKVAEAIAGKPVINIDHHISNENFGLVNWVDAKASSAGEMVYRIFKEAGEDPTKSAALCLYIAILTDTGSFNYDNTSSVTHEIAGKLLGYGLDPADVSEKVYERCAVSDIRLLGAVLSTIRVSKNGEVAYMEVTRDMLKATGADIARSEGLVNYARSIDGVKVALLFREDSCERGKVQVSFRSKGTADVNKIATYFGGGGHMKAAGCIIMGDLPKARRDVLRRVQEILSGGR